MAGATLTAHRLPATPSMPFRQPAHGPSPVARRRVRECEPANRSATLAVCGFYGVHVAQACCLCAPRAPHLRLGYIASGAPLGDGGSRVERFVEKPPLADAETMVANGGFSWNAGIFLFRAGRMRDAMLEQCRAIFEAADDALAAARRDGEALYAGAAQFARAPADSIDCAVMEKDDRVAVVPVAMGWSDLGSWQAVHGIADARDGDGNVALGDVLLHDCRSSLVRAGDKKISMIGLDDIAVIVDGDHILVMPLARSQDVRVAAKARE